MMHKLHFAASDGKRMYIYMIDRFNAYLGK